MGATEQQLGYLTVIDVDVSSYSNVLLSFGFLMFGFAFSLIYLWESLTEYPNSPKQNNGYTEVDDTEAVLLASSAFLDDDEQDENDAVELKDTSSRHTTQRI